MPKHLTPPVDDSWLYRLPEPFRRPPDHRTFEFPARPSTVAPLPPGDRRAALGAGGEFSTGTGARPHSLPLTPSPSGVPVPVGHLTLVDRIKRAAERIDDLEEDCA